MVAGAVINPAALEANGPLTASYLTDWDTVWGKLTAIFADYTAWEYREVGKRQLNARKVSLAFYDKFLKLINYDHMLYVSENIIQNAVYHGERKNNTFERYVMIQKE